MVNEYKSGNITTHPSHTTFYLLKCNVQSKKQGQQKVNVEKRREPWLVYLLVCVVLYGVIQSPEFPLYYPNGRSCLYYSTCAYVGLYLLISLLFTQGCVVWSDSVPRVPALLPQRMQLSL